MDADKGVPGRMAFVCRCTKRLIPPGLASLFVQSRAYQMSVTLPALVEALPLWIRIVSMLADRMSTWWKKSMDTMWVPAALLNPWVMAAPEYDSKPTHCMPVLGRCCKLT